MSSKITEIFIPMLLFLRLKTSKKGIMEMGV